MAGSAEPHGKNRLPDKHDGGHSEPHAVRVWLRLITCSLIVEKRIRRRLAEQFDTTLPRFDVLAALERKPNGMSMGDLSKALLVSGGNLTSLVRQLQRQDLVEMERAANDARSWIVRISDRGRAHFHAVAAEHHRWIATMFEGMSAEQTEQLYELLDVLKFSLAQSQEVSR